MSIRIQDQSPEVTAMAVNWPMVEALLGGTSAMRQAGRKYLPQWPAEHDDAYAVRLSTATLFPAFRRTMGVMANKPFAKQLTVGKNVPPDVTDLLPDVNRQGDSLHSVASALMAEALSFGLCGVLVDYPTRPDGVRVDRASERLAGLRPYLVAYGHAQILGWRSEQKDGRIRLTQLRLLESAWVPDGDYGAKQVLRVRLLTPGAWQLFEEAANGGFVPIAGGQSVNMSEIPFVPFYGSKLGFMRGESPLLDLAHLNVKHWQSQCDQDTILHVARVPILAVIGAEDGTDLAVGASSAVKLPPGADMHFVEHSGAAIGSGAAAIAALETQMIQTGAELLVKQPGQRTATESANDAEANKSELLGIVERFEDSLDQCLQFMAQWLGKPDGGNVSLFKDFAATSLGEASAQLLLALQQGGVISKETLIREEQRRGVLSPDIDPATELNAVKADGPSLGMVGNGDGQ